MKKLSIKNKILVVLFILVGGITVLGNPLFSQTSFARVTISDSAPEATNVTYVVNFEFQVASTEVTLTFDEEFRSRTGAIDTSNEAACSDLGDVITCTAAYAATTTHTLTFTGMTNPTKVALPGVADTYTIQLESDGGEWGNAMFAIIEPVEVKARVSALLSFVVTGVDAGENIHTTTTGVTTTPTSINFGTLEVDTPVRAAQDLAVTTNASEGYSVTVFQDGRLTSPGGETIKNFRDDVSVARSAAAAWGSLAPDLNDPLTWGHFGFTSQDRQVGATCLAPTSEAGYFFGGGWAGFNGTTPEEIMCHTGPSDGSQEHTGTTRVGYQVEISALQPAGEYNNILTYIATPTF